MSCQPGRTFTVAALVLAMWVDGAHGSRAKADGGLTLIFGLALLGATVLAIGAVAGTAKLVQVIAKDGPAPSPPLPAPASVPAVSATVPPKTSAAAPSTGGFLARPHCDTVGGYEAYLKSTGQLCRLH